MKRKKVFVVGGDRMIETMFSTRGSEYSVLYGDAFEKPDLVVFTGGADVSPEFYNEKRLSVTYPDMNRDTREQKVFDKYLDTPKVGICRGGQFLNVMSGGAMWQDVNNHGGNHDVIDLLLDKKPLIVSSTHHQMMIPAKSGDVVAVTKRATRYVSAKDRPEPKFDTEVVWYGDTKSLCFQPHPEYPYESLKDCRTYFFKLLDALYWKG